MTSYVIRDPFDGTYLNADDAWGAAADAEVYSAWTDALRALREVRVSHPAAEIEPITLVREVERLRAPTPARTDPCDGDHAAPACASLECWRSPSPDELAGLRAQADLAGAGDVTVTVDRESLRWLVDLAERVRSQRRDTPSASPMSRDQLVAIAHQAALALETDPRRLRVVVAVTCAEDAWIGVGSNTSPTDTHAMLVSACYGAERQAHPEVAREPAS